MSTFLAIALIAAMIATVAALVRGLVVFLSASTAAVHGEGDGPSSAAIKSNKMMQYRIFFQAVAVMIVVLILFLAGRT